MTRKPAAARSPDESARRGAWSQRWQRGSRPGAAGEAEYGAAGVAFFARAETTVALFELTSDLAYPDLEDAGTEHFDREPTASATAKMLWCHHFHSLDETPAGEPIRSYGGADGSKPQTIYHTAAFRNAHGYAIGHPCCRSGTRLFCLLNRQSGRWEILSPPLDVWRFELKTALAPGGWATAYLLPFTGGDYAADVQVEFTVYDAILGRLRGRARSDSLAGAQGYAQYMPDSDRWEIVAMQQPARFVEFSLSEALGSGDAAAAAAVDDFWDGYDPDPDDEGITVYNKPTHAAGTYLFAGDQGDRGMAVYDERDDKYKIWQMEC